MERPRNVAPLLNRGSMADTSEDKTVHCLVANNIAELDQIVAYLPRVVADGLMRTLDEAREAYRYDASAQRAYFFRREGDAVSVWSWNDIHSAAEYGDLVSLIVRLEMPFDEEQANKVYLGATGRGARQPFLAPPDRDQDA